MICRIDTLRSHKYIGPFKATLLSVLALELPFEALLSPFKSDIFHKHFHHPLLHLHNKTRSYGWPVVSMIDI